MAVRRWVKFEKYLAKHCLLYFWELWHACRTDHFSRRHKLWIVGMNIACRDILCRREARFVKYRLETFTVFTSGWLWNSLFKKRSNSFNSTAHLDVPIPSLDDNAVSLVVGEVFSDGRSVLTDGSNAIHHREQYDAVNWTVSIRIERIQLRSTILMRTATTQSCYKRNVVRESSVVTMSVDVKLMCLLLCVIAG